MGSPAKFDFDAFISYRRIDGTGIARWLRTRLERYRLPQGLAADRKPIRAYLDTAFERATEDFWLQNIEPALRRSRFLIVVLTPSVFEARNDGEPSWVEREIRLFLSLPNGRNILVVTAGTNPLDRLPESLRAQFPRMDVVDLNEFGRRWSFTSRSSLQDRTLTLIARIYDIADTDMPLLRQEEERRRRQRTRRVVTGAVSLVIVLSALLIFALVQWSRAAHERTAAEARSLGLAAQQDFDSGRHIQALFEAIDGGGKLRMLAPRDAELDEYPTAAPLLALNRILQGIRERNRTEHEQDSMRLQSESSTTDLSRCALPEGLAAPGVARSGSTDSGLATFMGHRGRILAKGCTPDGRYLVTTATDGTVRMTDLALSQSAQLIGLQGAARFLRFDPDARHFTTTDVWGTTVDWDLSGASTGLRATLTGHRSTVRAISFSKEGTRLVTGSSEGEIRIWNSGAQPVGDAIPGHQSAIVALWLSEDGTRLVAVNAGGEMIEWQDNILKPSRHLMDNQATIIDAAISHDGGAVGVAIAGGAAQFYDLRTGKSASIVGRHRGWIMGVAISPRANLIATAGADDTIGLHRPSGEPFGSSIQAAQGQVMGVAFSPDGNLLASAGEDGTVKLWDLTGRQLGLLIGHEGKVLAVRFSPNGRLIVTAGADGTVRLWRRDGEQLGRWPGLTGFLAEEALGGSFGTAGLTFSPDGQSIAVGASAGSVRIYRLQRLDELLDSACKWLGPYRMSHPDAPHVCH